MATKKELSEIARLLGSRGGKRGGKARWEGLSDEERSAQMSEIARRPRPGARKKKS
jgi:hypothetical protein